MGILDDNCRYRDIKQLYRYSNECDDVHTLVEFKLVRILEQFAVFAEMLALFLLEGWSTMDDMLNKSKRGEQSRGIAVRHQNRVNRCH